MFMNSDCSVYSVPVISASVIYTLLCGLVDCLCLTPLLTLINALFFIMVNVQKLRYGCEYGCKFTYS